MPQIVGATILLLIAGGVFFPVFLFWNSAIQRTSWALPRFGQAPVFARPDQNGNQLGSLELRQHVWVADFIRATGSVESEILSSKLAELDRNFQKSGSLALVSFVLDADDKALLQDYAAHHEASAKWHFIGASGDLLRPALEEWGAIINHDSLSLGLEWSIVLVDGEGGVRGIYDADSPEVVPQILIDIGSLLRDRSK